jgi:hypothetical protein
MYLLYVVRALLLLQTFFLFASTNIIDNELSTQKCIKQLNFLYSREDDKSFCLKVRTCLQKQHEETNSILYYGTIEIEDAEYKISKSATKKGLIPDLFEQSNQSDLNSIFSLDLHFLNLEMNNHLHVVASYFPVAIKTDEKIVSEIVYNGYVGFGKSNTNQVLRIPRKISYSGYDQAGTLDSIYFRMWSDEDNPSTKSSAKLRDPCKLIDEKADIKANGITLMYDELLKKNKLANTLGITFENNGYPREILLK